MNSSPRCTDRSVPFWRDSWILAGLLLFSAFRVLYYFEVASTLPLLGDEGGYYQNASVVLRIVQLVVSGHVASGFALAASLVDRGWFLPGMSIVLVPVRVISESVPVARVYVGVLNSLLFVLCCRRLARLYGIVPTRIAVACVAVFPYHAAFSFTFWGDLIAGHGLLFLLIVFAETQRDTQRSRDTDRARPILMGATILTLIYVRPSLTLLVPASLLFLLLINLQVSTCLQAVWRTTAAGAAIAAIVALGVLPWSHLVSKKFGGLFITTTSVDLNIIYAFGSRSWQSTIAPGDNPWVFIFNVIQEKAKSTGKTFGAVSKEWRNDVIGSLTLRNYAAVVRNNLLLFFLNERDFLERFASPDFRTRGKVADFDAFNRFIIVVNSVLWRIGLPVFVVALLLPWRLVGPGWWLGLFSWPSAALRSSRFFPIAMAAIG
jgi:hypothetical protein